jgi:hypothetical protein
MSDTASYITIINNVLPIVSSLAVVAGVIGLVATLYYRRKKDHFEEQDFERIFRDKTALNKLDLINSRLSKWQQSEVPIGSEKIEEFRGILADVKALVTSGRQDVDDIKKMLDDPDIQSSKWQPLMEDLLTSWYTKFDALEKTQERLLENLDRQSAEERSRQKT